MKCDRVTISHYDGQRSQVILGMIRTQIRKENNTRLPKVLKDPTLIKLRKQYTELSKNRNNTRKQIETYLDKKGLEIYFRDDYDDTKDSITAKDCENIPETDAKELQRAQDLYALGRKTEAKQVWDAIIKKYKLV